MKEKYFELSHSEKELIKDRLRDLLQKTHGVVFAYLHGSFLAVNRSRDIDLAIYLEKLPSSPLELELRLEAEFSEAIGNYTVDVRILNTSPLSFRYNVIKEGELIVNNDDDLRTEFEEEAITNYIDFAPFRKMYLQEVLGLGV